MIRMTRRRFLALAAGAGGAAALGAGTRLFQEIPGIGLAPIPAPGLDAAGWVTARKSAFAFGARVSMTVLHSDPKAAEKALAAALDELARVEAVMSLYRPESQISHLNRTGCLVRPAPDLVTVLAKALEISEKSAGAFDVTVQPLWETYARNAASSHRIPPPEEVNEARRKVDWRRLSVSPDEVCLKGQGMAVTLNGIAQGFAADRVLAVLRAHGVEHALVDTGEIGTLGAKASGEPWTVGIQHPRQPDAYIEMTRIHDRCMATSGDYATTFSEDRVHHHIFDPATGRSPEQLASVTVLAPTALDADALSTAIFVLGADRGTELLKSFRGTDAMLVLKEGRTLATPGFPRRASL
jgi:thiamine biosynthesis lipoprotein